MKLSKLNELPATREMIDVFRGYNHNLRIGEGEFYDMTNLTSSDYPVLSPRPQRGTYKPTEGTKTTPVKPLGMIAKDTLCYVEGVVDEKTGAVTKAELYINGDKIEDISLTPDEKTLISMGSYIIIMPDKLYINIEDHSDNGKIEASFTADTGEVEFQLCKLDGTIYDIPKANISNTVPALPDGKEEHDDLTLWLDTSNKPHSLKQYSKASSQWVSIATTYIQITFKNTSADLTTIFSNGDGLAIKGITASEQLKELNTSMVAWEVGTNYIIVTGILDEVKIAQTLSEEAPIEITRSMPKMQYIIESGNRLWGCNYGKALNGEVVNEIYASKLGDFKNWNSFAGISTDSYVASVGTDGVFTGAINHLGYPIFFKENCMHKVYGSYPANYNVQLTECRGVQRGCSKSLAIVNETLYYKSRSAICGYDGALPVEVSSVLGDVTYSDAVAGVLGNKYYISMKSSDGKYHLFVYDTRRGMWHREDETEAVQFCNCDGNLYYIDRATNRIREVIGVNEVDKVPIKWDAITGIIGTDSPDKKYISRINVRLNLEVGTRVYFYIEYDSCGTWEHLYSMTSHTLKTFSIPIKPKRCDHLRLKINGDGEAKIYSITKTIEQGSDI